MSMNEINGLFLPGLAIFGVVSYIAVIIATRPRPVRVQGSVTFRPRRK